MAKNQRQRRPLQDEGRTNKKTARERKQASRRQRDRIEENRDRREQRRERERLRRQTVDSIRSPKEDVRVERFDSRIVPVEDTFLGQPVGAPRELPVVIGERWDLSANQTFAHSVTETILFDTPAFTTERNGYPAIYTASSGTWRIPAGLAGIWAVPVIIRYDDNPISTPDLRVVLNGATVIGRTRLGAASGDVSMSVRVVYEFQEADEFVIDLTHFAGVNADITGSANSDTWAFAPCLGK
jgi:hypothetical protein